MGDQHWRLLIAVTLGSAALWAGWPGVVTLAVQLAALAAALLVVAAAVRTFVAARAPTTRGAPDEPPSNPVAEEYERLRRQVDLATQREAGLDAFLVRELREIVARLLLRYGVELEQDREQARRLVGDEVWELIRPGHRAASIRGRDLGRVLDRLEAL
ncbi:MAG TPA: hypothetical protein VF101_07015 [Gaiellaceae bacterium]